jgi:hypothetical protein
MSGALKMKVRKSSPPSRVSIVRGARMALVDPTKLFVTTIRNARVVALSDLWVASQLPGDLVDLSFDFVSDDGFRSTEKRRPRLGIAMFLKGYLDLETRDVLWDEGVDVPWYYQVKSVRTIIADDASLEITVLPPEGADARGA